MVLARATRDEIHHGTGDVLLMVTVGDSSWAGCIGPSSSSLLAFYFVLSLDFFYAFLSRLAPLLGTIPAGSILLHLYSFPVLCNSFIPLYR